MPTNGLVVMTPTSVSVTGSGSESANINADGSVAFSAVTSLSLNGVFTSDYDNYMINLHSIGSGFFTKYLRLRSSGSDASGTNYANQRWQVSNTGFSHLRSTAQSVAIGCSSSSVYAGDKYIIYGPFLSQQTMFRVVSALDQGLPATTQTVIQDYVNTHSLNTSYDGLSFITSTSTVTFTGLLTVCGFNQ